MLAACGTGRGSQEAQPSVLVAGVREEREAWSARRNFRSLKAGDSGVFGFWGYGG